LNNILNDGARRTTITYKDAHENDDASRITITYKDAHDRSRRTTIAGKKRGRKKLPIPSENILTAYDKQVLSSPYLTPEKLRTYEKLYNTCGCSLTALKRFLDKYYPIASRDRKILRRYIQTYSLVKDTVDYVLERHNSNPLVTKEELERLVYEYIKRKLKRCISPTFSDTLETEGNEGGFCGEFSRPIPSREGDANESSL